MGFPGGSVVKYPPANAGEEMQVPPLGQEGPTPVFLPGKYADKGAWRAYLFEEIPLVQGKRNPSKTVGVTRGHQRADTLKP